MSERKRERERESESEREKKGERVRERESGRERYCTWDGEGLWERRSCLLLGVQKRSI